MTETSKASIFVFGTFSAKQETSVRASHSEKALLSMLPTPEPMVTDARLLQLLKVYDSILYKPSGMVIEVRLLQIEKALLPSNCNLLGREMEARLVQPWKA